MKKYTFVLATFVAITMVACGSGSSTTESKDSSVAPVDTTAVVPSDSVVAPVGGAGSSKDEVEKPVNGEATK